MAGSNRSNGAAEGAARSQNAARMIAAIAVVKIMRDAGLKIAPRRVEDRDFWPPLPTSEDEDE